MIHGKNHIGYQLSAQGTATLKAKNANDWTDLEGDFSAATDVELNLAVDKAVEAFQVYQHCTGEEKANFLETIASEIEGLNTLIERAMAESALPKARLIGERGRTCNQLRLFAALLREGSWVDAKIERAEPNRQPLPRVDIRKMSFPIGPVAVFTASNFPLAFSTAGGDTASALASGCPVIVKAHESHLGTNQLVADAIIRAAQKTGMPEGVFSSVQSLGYEIGAKLVRHPKIKAVAFTGSQKGGDALYKLCQQRKVPIPLYAEMGSINPVVLLPNKLKSEAKSLAENLANSITLGVGQFCTNPGLIIGIKSPELDLFKRTLIGSLQHQASATMLNEGICQMFHQGRQEKAAENKVEILLDENTNQRAVKAALLSATAKDFIANESLKEEVFGPFSLLVVCENPAEIKQVLNSLSGQLTLSLMANDTDVLEYKSMIQSCTNVAGRVIFNAAPTGVEVCHAMHHGGTYPASSNSKYTSVGQDAIQRFVHPIAFQSCPATLLPLALQDENPLGIWRWVDGVCTNKAMDYK